MRKLIFLSFSFLSVSIGSAAFRTDYLTVNSSQTLKGPIAIYDSDNSNFIELRSSANVTTNASFSLPVSFCPPGQFLTIDISSAIICDAPAGSGDITSVNAGYGLSGGGVSGDVTLSLSTNTTSYIQNTLSPSTTSQVFSVMNGVFTSTAQITGNGGFDLKGKIYSSSFTDTGNIVPLPKYDFTDVLYSAFNDRVLNIASMTLVFQTNSISGGVGISGVAWNPRTKRALLVDNNALDIKEIDPSNPTVNKRLITLTNFTDPEALEFMWYDRTTNRSIYAVAEEGLNRITVFAVNEATGSTLTINRTDWTSFVANVWTPDASNGMEGMTYVPEEDAFYVCKQRANMRLYKVPRDQSTPTEPFNMETLLGGGSCNDLSYDYQTGHLFVVSDASDTIKEFDKLTGIVYSTLTITTGGGFGQQEGLAFVPSGNDLLVSSEGTAFGMYSLSSGGSSPWKTSSGVIDQTTADERVEIDVSNAAGESVPLTLINDMAPSDQDGNESVWLHFAMYNDNDTKSANTLKYRTRIGMESTDASLGAVQQETAGQMVLMTTLGNASHNLSTAIRNMTLFPTGGGRVHVGTISTITTELPSKFSAKGTQNERVGIFQGFSTQAPPILDIQTANGSSVFSVFNSSALASRTMFLNQGYITSTGTYTNLSPGVMHIVSGSSNVVTGLVSLSTEVIGVLPLANMASGATYYIQNTLTPSTTSQQFSVQLSSAWASIVNTTFTIQDVASSRYMGFFHTPVAFGRKSNLYVNQTVADGDLFQMNVSTYPLPDTNTNPRDGDVVMWMKSGSNKTIWLALYSSTGSDEEAFRLAEGYSYLSADDFQLLGLDGVTLPVKFYDADHSNFTALRSSASLSTDDVYTLPSSAGTPGQALLTDGDNNLYFGTVAGSGDNLGNHVATTTINASAAGIITSTISISNLLSGRVPYMTSGGVLDDSGIRIDTGSNNVGINKAASGDYVFDVAAGGNNSINVDAGISFDSLVNIDYDSTNKYLLHSTATRINGDASIYGTGFVQSTFTVVGGTFVLRGTTYYWPVNSGSSGQVLTSNGSSPATLTWSTSSGGSADNLGNHVATTTLSAGFGISQSTGRYTSLSPGVMHIQATSSNVVTGLVSLSTEVTGILPIANGGTAQSSFDDGSVIFSQGANLAGDATNFYYDYSSFRLGIRNNVPTAPLTINADPDTDGGIVVNTTEHSSLAQSDIVVLDSLGEENIGLASWNGGLGTAGYGAAVFSSNCGTAGCYLGELSGKNSSNGFRIADIIFHQTASADTGGISVHVGRGGGAFATNILQMSSNGTRPRIGIGQVYTSNTDLFHIMAGGTTDAPIRFTSGSLPTGSDIRAGQLAFLTDKLYFTQTTGTERREITLNSTPLIANRILFASTNTLVNHSSNFTYYPSTNIVYVGTVSLTAGHIESSDGIAAPTSAANTGRLRYNNTTKTWQQSNDTSAWVSISTTNPSIDGSGANTRVAFWTDSDTLSSDSAFTFDSTNNYLGVGLTGAPSYAVEARAPHTGGPAFFTGTVYKVTGNWRSSSSQNSPIVFIDITENTTPSDTFDSALFQGDIGSETRFKATRFGSIEAKSPAEGNEYNAPILHQQVWNDSNIYYQSFISSITVSGALSTSTVYEAWVDAQQVWRVRKDGNAFSVMPATQTITAGSTVTANGCMTIKRLTSDGAVTTSTAQTFDAANSENAGCIMTIINVGSNNITLDSNSTFISSGGADVVLTANDSVTVGSTGVYWYQIGNLVSN